MTGESYALANGDTSESKANHTKDTPKEGEWQRTREANVGCGLVINETSSSVPEERRKGCIRKIMIEWGNSAHSLSLTKWMCDVEN